MTTRRPGDHHDWHSAEYVSSWITQDVTRDDERSVLVRRMLELAPFATDAGISVLDVGGGYGVISEQVLDMFPQARVTLQDYSEPMLAQARKRLDSFGDRVSFVQRDFTEPDWTAGLGGPFDLAVSGIAIHNLGASGPIPHVYAGVCGVLKPGGAFLNLDYAEFSGGIEAHLRWLKEAGFDRAEEAWKEHRQSAMASFK
ncbi:MAG: methyltransferase domain-containing protein [Dehalococcoidia bacterium]